MVDTSQLIKDEHDLFSTKRVACLFKNEQMMNMIASSPNKNVLSRVLNQKTRLRPDMMKERELFEGDHCLLTPSVKLLTLMEFVESKIYLLGKFDFSLPLHFLNKIRFYFGIPFVQLKESFSIYYWQSRFWLSKFPKRFGLMK